MSLGHTIVLPSLPAIPATVILLLLIAVQLLPAGLVVTLVVALVVTLAVVSAVVAVLVKDHKGSNHSWHPSAASEDESDEKRPAPLVDHGKRREDNSQKYSHARHNSLSFKC